MSIGLEFELFIICKSFHGKDLFISPRINLASNISMFFPFINFRNPSCDAWLVNKREECRNPPAKACGKDLQIFYFTTWLTQTFCCVAILFYAGVGGTKKSFRSIKLAFKSLPLYVYKLYKTITVGSRNKVPPEHVEHIVGM